MLFEYCMSYYHHDKACSTQTAYCMSYYHHDKAKRKHYKQLYGRVYSVYIGSIIGLAIDLAICSMIEVVMKQTKTVWENISFFISFGSLNILVFGTWHCYKLISNNMYKI